MDIVYQSPSGRFLQYSASVTSWVDNLQLATVMSPARITEDKVLRAYIVERNAVPVQVRVVRRIERL